MIRKKDKSRYDAGQQIEPPRIPPSASPVSRSASAVVPASPGSRSSSVVDFPAIVDQAVDDEDELLGRITCQVKGIQVQNCSFDI